jgi:RimJ/RimL family protein N-acetyltransferase
LRISAARFLQRATTGTLGLIVVRIRDATPQDAASLIGLRKAIFGESDFMLYAPSEYTVSSNDVVRQIERISQSGDSRLLLTDSEGMLVGFLTVTGSDVPRRRHAASIVVGVLRDYWGRGIAGAMLSEVLRWAPTVGISRLELGVMTENQRAIALYKRFGFQVEGTRRRAYIVGNKPVDEHLMAHVDEA